MDIMMPEMDGYQLISKLRENESTKSIPVIMLTAKKEAKDVIKSMIEKGAVDYIVKPFTAVNFLEKIKVNKEAIKKYEENTLSRLMEDKVKRILEERDE